MSMSPLKIIWLSLMAKILNGSNQYGLSECVLKTSELPTWKAL